MYGGAKKVQFTEIGKEPTIVVNGVGNMDIT